MTIIEEYQRSCRKPEGKFPFRLVKTYITSSWAWYSPYLAAYLLYACCGWSVNPLVPGKSIAVQAGHMPHLLHVYWTLHLVHLVLLGFVAFTWWRFRFADKSDTSHWWPASEALPLGSIPFGLLAWVSITLLFILPGVYLEFPSDPWHHYGRVNEWSSLDLVTEHSTWKKSSYFLAYSLIGQIHSLERQLGYFNFYYAFCSLLLCLEYYRLGKVLGLKSAVAFVFTLLAILTFGNDIFSFYRYYGMGSTIISQIGCVALSRLVIQFAAAPNALCAGSLDQDHPYSFTRYCNLRAILIGCCQLVGLLALIACNHIQGIGISALAISAIVCWRLISWRRSMWLVLGGTMLLASILAAIFWPFHPLVESQYVSQGWFSPWKGFNFYSLSSPAFQRSAMIVGSIGLLNFFAGIYLFSRNNLVGWLTVMPVLLLSLPVVSIPFSNVLATATHLEQGYTFMFNRMLFAIPSGLALVTLVTLPEIRRLADRVCAAAGEGATRLAESANLGFYGLLLALSVVLTLPNMGPFYNRLYTLLVVTAEDVAMRPILTSAFFQQLGDPSPVSRSPLERAEAGFRARSIIAPLGIGYVLNASGRVAVKDARKWITWPTLTPPSLTVDYLLKGVSKSNRSQSVETFFPPIPDLYTRASFVGQLSRHWLPNEVAIEYSGQRELKGAIHSLPQQSAPPMIWLEWLAGSTHEVAQTGFPTPIMSSEIIHRGAISDRKTTQPFKRGDRVTFRPVLWTKSGDGYSVQLLIQGPGYQLEKDILGKPDPLRGENWVFGDQIVILSEPGKYKATITGTLLAPTRSYTVEYTFCVGN